MQDSCDILEEAVKRYKQIIVNESRFAKKLAHFGKAEKTEQEMKESIVYRNYLTGLDVYLKKACEAYPQLSSSESC